MVREILFLSSLFLLASAQWTWNSTCYATSYGWDDNSPPSAEIAYPKDAGYPTVHNEATEGSGYYYDPVTMATDQAELPPGTMVYMCHVRKYVVMEDECTACEGQWNSGNGYRLDVWVGPQYALPSDQLWSCEGRITVEDVRFIVNPPTDYPVDTTPFINPYTGECTANVYYDNCAFLYK